MKLPYTPAVQLLGVYLKDFKSYYADTYIAMFIVALSTITRE